MSKAVLASVLAVVSSFASLAHADSIVHKIDCTGKTSDNRAAQVTVTVDASVSAYPAPATVLVQVGTDSPLNVSTNLTMLSGQDVSNKTVYLFSADLTADRAFGARTFDLHTGVGAMKLDGTLRAPMLSCTFSGN